MKFSLGKKQIIIILALMLITTVLAISLTGILFEDGGNPYTFNTIRGGEVLIYGGSGLYRFDAVEKAYIGRAFDWMNLFLALPLFITGLILYIRGSSTGTLLLLAGFFHFFYNYFLGMIGMAFNELFLLYVALYSLGLFGFFVLLASIDITEFSAILLSNPLRKLLSYTLFFLGLVFLLMWLNESLTPFITGKDPSMLLHYTTIETQGLDLGIFVPVSILGAILYIGKNRWGGIISVVMLIAAMETFASLTVGLIIMNIELGTVIAPVPVFFFVLLACLSLGFIIMHLRKSNKG